MVLSAPGVDNAVSLGEQPQKFYIDVSSRDLAGRGLTLDSISEALAGQNAVDAAGSITTSERSVRISVEGGVTTPEDVRELRLRSGDQRSEEHTSELQSLMRNSYAVFCLKKKKTKTRKNTAYTTSS